MAKKYSTFGSDYISYTLDNEKGKIAFLGIESGGRDRDKHASYNLTLPGYGAMFGAFKKNLPISQELTDASASFENENGEGIKYTLLDTKTLSLDTPALLPQ